MYKTTKLGPLQKGPVIFKAFALIMLALAAAVCCVSCSQKPAAQDSSITEPAPENTAGAEQPEASEAVTEPAVTSDADAALAAYRNVLAQADSYDYGADPELEKTGYSYALVMMQSDDTVPTLLVAQATAFGVEYVRVFRYDTETGKLIEPVMPESQGPLMQGAGSAGGFRYELSLLEDGSGLCALCFSAGSGDATMDMVAYEGGALTVTGIWEGSVTETAPFAAAPIENWFDIADESGLKL